MRKFFRIVRWILGAILIVVVLAAAYLLTNLQSDMSLETLKARWTDKTSRFVDVDGMQVHYRDEGSGPALVLLHGTSSSLHTWDGWNNALKKSFRVLRLDLPGFGLTGPHPSRNYEISTYVSFLEHFVGKVGIERFALAGNSLGGTIAWNYAATHPERLSALILIDAGGHAPRSSSGGPLAFRAVHWPVIPEIMVRLDPRPFVEDGVKKTYGDPGRIRPETIDRYYELTLRPGNREAFVDRMRLPFTDETARLRAISAPTLVMWGARDQIYPVEIAKLFERDVKGSRAIVYDDLGHIPMEEDAPRTSADAQKFLAEQAPKAAK
jgi:pimeloyl-ACP methyl ester carboxylesterase